MAWTYTGDPATVPLDEVRFLVGDTDPDDPQLYDGEVNYALTKMGSNPYKAASLCCQTLAAKYARQCDTEIETVKESASQKMRHYENLARSLWEADTRLNTGLGRPFVAGVSLSEIKTVHEDTDRNPSSFTDNLFSNPRKGGTTVLDSGATENGG